MTTLLKNVVGVLVLAAVTVALWWIWLGRDTTYQTAANGTVSGPYEAPQVVGLVLCLVVLIIVASMLIRPWFVVPAVALTLTMAWSVNAAAKDDTGLWVVGAILVLFGSTAGTAAVSFTTWAVARRPRRLASSAG